MACSTNFSLSSNDDRIFGASLSWGVDCLETGVAEDDGLVDGSHVMGPLYLWPNPRDRPVLSDSALLFSYFSDVSLSLSLSILILVPSASHFALLIPCSQPFF